MQVLVLVELKHLQIVLDTLSKLWVSLELVHMKQVSRILQNGALGPIAEATTCTFPIPIGTDQVKVSGSLCRNFRLFKFKKVLIHTLISN